MVAGAMILAAGAGPKPPDWTLVPIGRTVAQDQGAWVIDYRLRLASPTGVILAPEEIGVKVDGWVSNSRVASHAVPRWSSLGIPHGPEFSTVGEVIAAPDEAHKCHEKLIVSVWASGKAESSGKAEGGRLKAESEGNGPDSSFILHPSSLPMSVAPEGIVHVRLRLEHQHVVYGDYDPLLAIRAVELRLGQATVRDHVPLDHEQYLAQPRFTWPEPPEDRRDTRHAVSGPDSLHLEAHVPGHHYYRFPERPVRYGTKMRLRFSYLIAAGTEGECRLRIAQYKDTPASWRQLERAGSQRCLKTVGRWIKVEHVFTTDAEATTLAIDFCIAGDVDVGEMWIDDVSLEPVGCQGHIGP
jgi:hypothetical protein